MLPLHSSHKIIRYQWLALLLMMLLLVLGYAGHLYVISPDFAHHYALIAHIRDYMALPATELPNLKEMSYYPPGSHVLAAVLAFPLQSTLMGMQVLALGAVMLLWAGIFLMLQTLPRKLAILCSTILAALLYLNRYVLHLEIHGKEIVENYFFAQLLAQALSVMLLGALLLMEKRGKNFVLRYLLLVSASYALLYVHLLASLQILAFYCLYAALDIWQIRHANRGTVLRRVLVVSGLLGLVLSLLLSSPYFKAMLQISRYNGGLKLQAFDSFPALLAMCVFVGAVAVWMLWRHVMQGRQNTSMVVLKFFALFSLASSLLCLAQIALLQLGHGSEYAVRKYFFSLNSLFLLQLMAISVVLLKKYLPDLLLDEQPKRAWQFIALPALGMMVAFTSTQTRHDFSLAEMVQRERQFEMRRDLLLPQEPERFNLVAAVPDIPQMFSYLFTLGVLRAERNADSERVLAKLPLQDAEQISSLTTGVDSVYDQKFRACRQPGGSTAGGMVVLDGACLRKYLPGDKKEILFNKSHSGAACSFENIGPIEGGGRWTLARQARLRCPLPLDKSLRKIHFKAKALMMHLDQQKFRISVNGQAAQEFVFNKNEPERLLTLSLPPDSGTVLEMQLEMPEAISPKQAGISGDTRILGLSLRSLHFVQ